MHNNEVILRPGVYDVITDEEMIQGLSFASFRRVWLTLSALMRARLVSDKPLDVDERRGMAAQKTTDLRRVLADAEKNARELRDRQEAA